MKHKYQIPETEAIEYFFDTIVIAASESGSNDPFIDGDEDQWW